MKYSGAWITACLAIKHCQVTAMNLEMKQCSALVGAVTSLG